jgi:hypothetical protein
MAHERRDIRRPMHWSGLAAVAGCVLALAPAARGDDGLAPDAPGADAGAAHAGKSATALAFDAAGRLYAADPRAGRVTILGFAGQALGELGAGVLDRPTGVAVARSGDVLVSDDDGVHRFGADGAPAGGFAVEDAAAIAAAPDGTVYVGGPHGVARFAADGTPLGGFPAHRPRGIAVAADGTVWVAVAGGVLHATATGAPLGIAPADRADGVAVDPDGTVLVAEPDRGRVARLAADGSRVGQIEDGLDKPRGVAVDCRGNVAVSDDGKPWIHRIGVSPSALPPCGALVLPAAPAEAVRPVARRPPGRRAGPALVPVLARRAVAARVGGTVRVRRPNAASDDGVFASELLPMGSRLDARQGRVRLTFATATRDFDALGTTQSAEADAGMFTFRQRRGRSLVDLRLAGPRPACGVEGVAQPVGARHVWVAARGRFRTHGRHATATARDGRWLTEDRCDGTLVRVARGRVRVRDVARGRTVVVRAGGRYLAGPASR